MSLYVQIKRGSGSTTNYGPSPGLGVVSALEGELQGPGRAGQMTITILGIAAGYDIRARDLVKVFESSDGGTTLTNRVFLGFVQDIERTLTPGTRLVVHTLTCVDANVLEDWMRVLVTPGIHGVEDGGQTQIDKQLQRIWRAVIHNDPANTSDPIDLVSGMALSAALTTDITFDYMGLSARDMTDKRLKAYQASYPSQRPRQFMGFTLTGNAAAFLPQLNTYDETALLASAAKYTFSTEPSGGDKKVRSLRNKRTGANLTTTVQAKSNNQGPVIARATSSNTSVYPNTFDLRPFGPAGAALNAWDGPLLQLPDGATGAQVQATADQEIAAEENPGETFVFVTDEQLSLGLLPGDVVAITSLDLGLSGYKRVVSSVRIWYEQRAGGPVIVREVTAGNQLPELFGQAQPTYPVQEGDFVGPLPPTNLAMTFIDTGGEFVLFRLSYTGSASADAYVYVYQWTVAGQSYVTYSEFGTPPPTTFDQYLRFESSGQVVVWAKDTAGNPGPPSDPFTWTVGDVPRPPSANLYNGDFAFPNPASTTKPDGWVETVGGSGAGVIVSNPSFIKTRKALKIHCGVGDSDVWLSARIDALSADTATGTQFQLACRVLYYVDGTGSGTLKIGLRWYDTGNNLLSTSYLTNGIPVGNAIKTLTATLKAPTGTVYARAMVEYDGPPVSGSRDVYVAAFLVGPAAVSTAAGADGLDVADTTGHLPVPTTSGTKTGRPALVGSEVGVTWDSSTQRVQIQTSTLDYFIGATSATGGIWEPLTNGDATTPELIFVGGDVIMVGG